MPTRTAIVGIVTLFALAASAETLHVGPGKKFAQPSAAFRAAHEGDTVEIDSAGTYDGDVATIKTDRLTIRGVGKSRAKIPAAGKHNGGKAIWVITGRDATIENLEFSGARVPDHNGAGIRPEGTNFTVHNCRFYDCENGILGGVGEILIEHCEFDHCGPVAEPATHSLYIGGQCTKLTFRDNYSTFTLEGHLLKSRARENWILYNRLTDENGTGSAVADFPNGGFVVMIGNILHKGAHGHNSRVIAYGMEGLKYDRNALFVINNTMVYEHRHSDAFFVRVEKTPADFLPIIHNNLCLGAIPLCNSPHSQAQGNLLFKSAADADLVDPAHYDYHLRTGSPCIDHSVNPGMAGGFDLAPTRQYVHPCREEPRPVAGPLDVGAFEFVPIAK